MKELTLDELKEIEFNILTMFDSFCKENNIRYFLGYGTLLGAIRYKKFIPWDDDIDVLVPRDDYEKLIALFKDNERYKLFAFERAPEFPFPFAKLCDMTTRKDETIFKNNITMGLEIDIFPLDEWKSDYDQAIDEAKKIEKTTIWLGRTKLKKQLTKKKTHQFLWSIIIPFAKMLGSQYFVKKIITQSKANNSENPTYLGTKVWNVYREKGIIPAEVFSDTIEVEFEGYMFPAPIGYDTYLTCLYGDYMPEPPIEKQKTHHNFEAYKL